MHIKILNGSYAIVIIPDSNTVRTAIELTGRKHVRTSDYRVKREGVHVTLYGATFMDLPEAFARKLVDKLNEYVVHNRQGEYILRFSRVEPYAVNPSYLFWYVDEPKRNGRLQHAHLMSAALSAWAHPEPESDADFERQLSQSIPPKRQEDFDKIELKRKLRENEIMFGHTLMGEEYLPHITLVADDAPPFVAFKPCKEDHLGSARRVVFARMGAWGQIEEILF